MKKPEENSWTTTNHSAKWQLYKPKFMQDPMYNIRKSSNREQNWKKSSRKKRSKHRHRVNSRPVPVVNSNNDKFASRYFQKKMNHTNPDVLILAMVALAAEIQVRNLSHDLINSHAKRR